MRCILSFLILCTIYPLTHSEPFTARDITSSDAYLSMVDLFRKYGYPYEIHQVTTVDGYILKMYRIPYGPKCNADHANERPAVFLLHGILCSSYSFLQLGKDYALGYLLADNCFDVWMGNNRGTYESINHVYLNKSQHKYWDFTWHEMGAYDMPAMVDYILNKTGQNQLDFVGHSQGATDFLVYTSLYPEESAKKINRMYGLAPICYLGNNKSPLTNIIANYLIDVMEIMFNLGVNELLPPDDPLVRIGNIICGSGPFTLETKCATVLFSFAGFDWENTNATAWFSGIGHFPAGASLKQFIHYHQIVKTGGFNMYDYGPRKNVELYGSISPPEYPVEKIKVPMFFYIGNQDRLGTPKDIHLFAKRNSYTTILPVNASVFNHIDFNLSKYAKRLVYDNLIDRLKEGYMNGVSDNLT